MYINNTLNILQILLICNLVFVCIHYSFLNIYPLKSLWRGYLSVSSLTIALALSIAASSPWLSITSAMASATFSTSSSLKPLLVMAGVPSLRPLVTNGLCGSLGIVFLLVAYVIYKKDYKKLVFYLPALISILVCVASPVNTYFRYTMPYVFGLPIMIAFVLEKKKID